MNNKASFPGLFTFDDDLPGIDTRSFETILHGMQAGIWICNLQTRQMFCNEETANIVGYPHKELSPGTIESWEQFLHPDDISKSRKTIIDFIEGKKDLYFVEVRMLHKHGHYINICSSGTVLTRASDGIPEWICGVYQDVTVKAQTEEKLREQSNLLHSVIDGLAHADTYADGLQFTLEKVCRITGWNIGEVWVPNDKNDLLEISPAWFSSDEELKSFYKISQEYTFEYGRGLPGRAWKKRSPVWITDVKSDSDFHRVAEAGKYGLSAGVAIPVIVDNEVVNVMVFFLKERKDEDAGFIQLISGIAKQLGELFLWKQAEERLRQLSHEFETVFESTQSAMFLIKVCTDGQFHYLRTNRAYERMSGYSHDDTHGKTPYHLFEKKAADEIIQQYKKCIAARKTIEYELHIDHRGERRVVQAELNPVKENGIIKYIVGSSTDVTEKEKIMVELLVAKEKAEESDRLKTAFLNNISHEIRTPLNGIIGFGQLLGQRGLTASQQQSFLKSMRKSSDRLIDTVEKIVDISLVLSDALEVNKHKLAVASVLQQVHNVFTEHCNEKNLEFDLEIKNSTKDIKILSDGELIQKALIHLVDNAIKFTDKGKIVLGLDATPEAMHIYVKDTGAGIDQAFLKSKIYEPFSQEDASITRGYEGSGLGLAIAKGIIKKLGGEIQAESKKGGGSTFTVILPFKEKCPQIQHGSALLDHDQASPVNENDTGNHPSTPPQSEKRSTPSILLADDDDMALFLLETLVEEIDARIISVENGRDAVEAVRANPGIGMVIMDIKMPGLDGIEATRQIKALRNDLPVIAVTAHAMIGDEHRIREAGCDDYISKPLNGKELLDKIIKLNPGLSVKK